MREFRGRQPDSHSKGASEQANRQTQMDRGKPNNARQIAETILEGFNTHYRTFRAISQRAEERFIKGDWHESREDVIRRINSYDTRVKACVETIRTIEGHRENCLWSEIKRDYLDLLKDHLQPECAETFYNSVACKILERRYYNNEHIFYRPGWATDYIELSKPIYRSDYPSARTLRGTVQSILSDLPFSNKIQNLKRSVHLILRAGREELRGVRKLATNFQIHTIRSLFYRNRAAYLVGRIINGEEIIPFVVPLLRDSAGNVFVDTILFDSQSIGRVFSLSRAYFMVDMEAPAPYVDFLRTILPSKPHAEIVSMLGLQKLGKTLFYRYLSHHLANSTDEFILAPGTRGMVMLVFTLPSFPYVFKVIRDHFDPPKEGTRATVEAKYRLVKYHDRVGRMADSLEYSDVALPAARFTPEVLEEFERLAPSMIERDGDKMIIRHCYIERRMIPLNLYLNEADEEERKAAILELGQALKDLAAVDIFPGDLALKNFGVTRFGKVVTYDYDEVCYLTDLNFRRMPTSSPFGGDDFFFDEPEVSVGPNDIFPEELPRFMFHRQEDREFFEQSFPELLDAGYYVETQRRIRSGQHRSTFPYAEELRFIERYSEYFGEISREPIALIDEPIGEAAGAQS